MKQYLAFFLAVMLVVFALPAMAVTVSDPMLPDPEKYQYEAKTTIAFNLRKEPDEKSAKLVEVKKGANINIIEYGDEWCNVEYREKKGYAKTKWLFMLKTSDPYKYPILGYDVPYGIGEMLISYNTKGQAGKTSNYSGNELEPGTMLTVHRYNPDTDVATILVWKAYIDLPAGAVKVTQFVPYDEAQPGDIIAGYTTYQSKKYGFPYHYVRYDNIALAVSRLDGAVVQPGELFSFNTLAAPYSKANGYKKARIMGGEGLGFGGGVCQISVLTRSAVLGLPVLIRDWYMHTDEGTVYTTQICDATVGNSRDFSFYNMLDYPIYMNFFQAEDRGVMNLFIYRSK